MTSGSRITSLYLFLDRFFLLARSRSHLPDSCPAIRKLTILLTTLSVTSKHSVLLPNLMAVKLYFRFSASPEGDSKAEAEKHNEA